MRWRPARWTREHAFFLNALFWSLSAVGVALDLVMVLVLGVDSISWRTWEATAAHPTLIGAGVLATVGVCWLVRTFWPSVLFAGMLGGHLFTHW